MEVCLICNKEYIKKGKTKTCSRSCGNKLAYKNGRKVIKKNVSNYETWVLKYGIEEAERKQALYKENMSKAIMSANMSLQKQSASFHFSEMNKNNKGKTLEEIYGEEKAYEIRQKLSKSNKGEKNPSFGKVRLGGKSVKGYYKGKFFRSLLELSFMKHLENSGLKLSEIEYECFRIPWINEEGSNRTYTIDFYVPSQNVVYEVKQSWALKTKEVELKRKFANDFFEKIGLQFVIVTENDFQKIKFEDALVDADIIFLKNTRNI
jgi:hypothetical protein